MQLVDTSVWIHHFRYGDERLKAALEQKTVLCHDWIVGELACGQLQARKTTLDHLGRLPQAPFIKPTELLYFIDQHRLFGAGLGLIDMQLLAACQVGACALWTNDKALFHAAKALGVRVMSFLPH
jgi:predicted nucleic acid-binding protein